MKSSFENLVAIESQLQLFERELRNFNIYHPPLVVFMRGDVGKTLDEDLYHFRQLGGEEKRLWLEAMEREMCPIGFFSHKVVHNRIQKIVKAIILNIERKWVISPADSRDGKGVGFPEFFERLLELQADDFMRAVVKDYESTN